MFIIASLFWIVHIVCAVRAEVSSGRAVRGAGARPHSAARGPLAERAATTPPHPAAFPPAGTLTHHTAIPARCALLIDVLRIQLHC